MCSLDLHVTNRSGQENEISAPFSLLCRSLKNYFAACRMSGLKREEAISLFSCIVCIYVVMLVQLHCLEKKTLTQSVLRNINVDDGAMNISPT